MLLRRLGGRLGAVLSSGGSAGGRTVRGRPASGGSDRGQSELVGTVLILGLSMTVIGTSVALGGVALGDLVSTAEADNAENGLSHLSSQVSLVALGDADSQRFSLGLMREGTVSVEPEAGSITISNVSGGSETELFESELGAIVYAGEDREVAYQGGGIWTKYDANSTLTSPPEYHYRGTTLTLPIIQISGEGAVGGRPTGRITPVGVSADAVPDVSTPLENGTIEIEIQSDYYEGWYEYLEQRTEGSTRIYHANETVVSTLTVPDSLLVDTAVSVRGNYNAGPGNSGADVTPDGSVDENVAHRSAKPLIERRVRDESGEGSGCLTTSGCTLTAGTYFYDGDLTLANDLGINTSDGNVTLVVNGSFDIDDQRVTVTDTETNNGVNYYVNGSLDAQGDGYVSTDNTAAEADRNVFYVRDGFLDTGTGTIRFDAVIYAPDAVIDSQGNAKITGALIADSVVNFKGSTEITYDTDLRGTTIDLTGADDLLTYLHVSHNEVRVDLD